MTAGSTDIERVRSRREEIAREIKDAKLRVSSLMSEDQELEIAERVILRLSSKEVAVAGVSGAAPGIFPPLPQRPVDSPKVDETPVKPEGIPTVPKMIIEGVKFAKLRGKPGLEPKGMTEFIANKWWPEVSINNVGPIAWRMWKRGQLAKDGSVYSLPENETPGTKEPGASDCQGDEGGTSSSSGSKESQHSLAAVPGTGPAHPGE